MRPQHSRIVLAVCFAATACFHVGPRAENLPVATQPQGALATVQTTGRGMVGELLALQDDGVILLENARLRFVPYGAIRTLTVEPFDDEYSLHGEVPTPERRARLSAVSRYPGSIDSALRQRLLAISGQSAIEVVP